MGLTLCAVLTACGGGGGALPSPQNTPVASPTAPPPPSSGAAQYTVQTVPTSIPLPSVGGFAGTLNLPAAAPLPSPSPLGSGLGEVTVSVSAAPPSGVPIVQSGIRSAMLRIKSATGVDTAILYITLTFTQPLQLVAVPGFTLVAPASNSYAGENVYLGLYEPQSGSQWSPVADPATIGGATASLNITNSGAITVAAEQPITFAVFETGPASMDLSLSAPLIMGMPSTDQISVAVRDQYGVSISGALKTPVTVADDDTSGRTSLSQTSISSTAQTLPLVYNGKGVRFTLSASEGSVQAQLGAVSVLPKENAVTGMPQGTPVGNAAFGADGNFWTVDDGGYGSTAISRITPSGTATNFTDTTPSVVGMGNVSPIAAGADGNIWTSLWDQNYFSGVLVRVTPNGTFTEFPGPASMQQGASSPSQLILGPDGAIWFTMGASDAYVANSVGIGRVDTSGHVSVVAATTNVPNSLVSGPDGNLWFQDGANIDKLTTGGTLTKYSLPNATSSPARFVVGPDGNFWMPFAYGSKTLVEFSTSGNVVATHQLPSTWNPTIDSLVTSGNYVYFTDAQSESAGRIDAQGNTVWYPAYSTIVSQTQAPLCLIKGPNNAWYLSSEPVLSSSPLQFGAGLTPLDLTLW